MAYRVTGVGAFGFSINWERAAGDTQVARAVLALLENPLGCYLATGTPKTSLTACTLLSRSGTS
jgi:hypothetical protein